MHQPVEKASVVSGRLRAVPESICVPELPMLGPAKRRRLAEPIAVSLEELVPADNFYRHLEDKLDLSFVREWVQELYAERGRPGIDPVVYFKLQLVMFFEGVRSERQLIATASLNLAHRWYLGYALDEELPDHSSLTRIRQRLGVAIFERFFEPFPTPWTRERQHPGTTHRSRTEPQALVGRQQLAPTPRPMWEPGGRPERAAMALSWRLAMTHPAGDWGAGEPESEWPPPSVPVAGGFFQHSARL
jgi:transposase